MRENTHKRYRLKSDEIDILKEYRGIKEACKNADADIKDIKHGWLKTDKASLFFKNPEYQNNNEYKEIDIEKVLKSIKAVKVKKTIPTDLKALFDKLVFTDVHIGMDASENGTSLYNQSWTKEDIERCLVKMIEFTLLNQKSDTLLISDLGDFLDGYNGYTTRGGHKLPQNMTNNEAFDFGLWFKMTLIESLVPYYKKIVVININDDNHAGDYAYTLNSAFKVIIEKMYKEVEVINQVKFLEHYIIKDYCFVSTHGKDKKHRKFGLKPRIDAKQVNYLTNHLNYVKLLNKGLKITIEKGDSHLYLFDTISSDLFDYNNYPCFSPPSNWVQHNFGKGSSGFIHFNYYDNRKSINEYFFQ